MILIVKYMQQYKQTVGIRKSIDFHKGKRSIPLISSLSNSLIQKDDPKVDHLLPRL